MRRAQQATYNHRRYVKRKAKGLCTWGACPNEAVTVTLCAIHAAEMTQRCKARRALRQAQGLCVSCGKAKTVSTVECLICRPRNRVQSEVRARKIEERERLKQGNEERRTKRNAMIVGILDKLSPRDARLARLRFGVDAPKDQTLEAVGKVLGLTRERVRQIGADILAFAEETEQARLAGRSLPVSFHKTVIRVRRHTAPERQRQVHLVTRSARRVALKPAPKSCQGCGGEAVLQHHEDYNKPLDTIDLCRKCHSRRHVEIRAGISLAYSAVIGNVGVEAHEMW